MPSSSLSKSALFLRLALSPSKLEPLISILVQGGPVSDCPRTPGW
jgi:hypothetical protein